MDVEDISPGQNFARAIEQTIANSKAVLVVIGPRWMEILRSRAANHQEDYVCHEIEAALKTPATIIPVLVGGATMAQLTDLPPGLADLPFHQAAELRDNTFNEDCARLAAALGARDSKRKAVRRKISWWAGASLAVLVLLFAVIYVAGVSPRSSRASPLINTAQTQLHQGEYEPAFKTYQQALAVDPGNRAALDGQVNAAMLWVRNFHVLVPEGRDAGDIAGPSLAEIMLVLHAGLARTGGRGSRAADILAHLGWAHWLNEHIAFKEFGSAVEKDLRQALAIDPSNVFAHAMLGNWLLQTHGSLAEAKQHFVVALKSNQQRPLVRTMQVGGMLRNDDPGVPEELIRVANQMRVGGETLDEDYKRRILEAYSPTLNNHNELTRTLSALPPDAAWETFLWLDAAHAGGSEQESQGLQREFIHASILELAGKTPDALAIFKTLQRTLKGRPGSLADQVTAAIQRISRPSL
jgi:tetratricopeptide (TPR) repeat protein